jgi:hypothetical protein
MANRPNVLGTIGNGPGKGQVQFTESNYMAMDSHGNLYSGENGEVFQDLGSKRALRLLS